MSDTTPTTSPYDLEKLRRKAVSAPFAVWMTILTLAVSGGIAWANLKAQVESITPLAAKVEKLAEGQQKLDVMANDIQWIKAELQRQRREASRP